jgi:hypothetical protein
MSMNNFVISILALWLSDSLLIFSIRIHVNCSGRYPPFPIEHHSPHELKWSHTFFFLHQVGTNCQVQRSKPLFSTKHELIVKYTGQTIFFKLGLIVKLKWSKSFFFHQTEIVVKCTRHFNISFHSINDYDIFLSSWMTDNQYYALFADIFYTHTRKLFWTLSPISYRAPLACLYVVKEEMSRTFNRVKIKIAQF